MMGTIIILAGGAGFGRHVRWPARGYGDAVHISLLCQR